MKSFPAGRRNRKILLQSTSGTDALNQPLNNWKDAGSYWAEFKGETGMGTIRNWAVENGLNRSTAMVSFRINYTPSLNETAAGNRVVFNNRYYNVLRFLHDEAFQRDTFIVCEVGGNNG